ncbi:hypothetical protein [Sphingomonas sp. LH128]|uniref:hypothetical protein n=1 Tax=Sphingomonas sp. LH128 TaxID=473781 RepID=UPI00155DED39|nr:hypothetical protein [Sphingomonas sp. LH128]
MSTRVTLKLERTILDQVLRFDPSFSRSETPVTFAELIGALCPMLDVDIFVDVDQKVTKIHSHNWFEEDRITWLRRISLPHVNKAINVSIEQVEAEIAEAAQRLTFVDPSDPTAGLAAVSGVAARGIRAVGMLRATEGFHQYANEFWGAIDYQPAGPRRSFGSPRSDELLARWATDQATLAAKLVSPGPQQRIVAYRVADFKGDASSIASISFDRDWLTLEEVFEKACRVGKVYAPIRQSSAREEDWSIGIVRERQSGLMDNYFSHELEFIVPIIEGVDASSSAYFAIPLNERPATFSFLAMMNKMGADRGVNISGRFIENFAVARYVGQDSPRQGLKRGAMINCAVLELAFAQACEGAVE